MSAVQSDLAHRLLRRVRELREGRGLSQEAFAEMAGLKYKHYQSIEAGRKIDIRLSTIEKLARACGMPPGDLLHFPERSFAAGEDTGRNAFVTALTGPRSSRRRQATKTGRGNHHR